MHIEIRTLATDLAKSAPQLHSVDAEGCVAKPDPIHWSCGPETGAWPDLVQTSSSDPSLRPWFRSPPWQIEAVCSTYA